MYVRYNDTIQVKIGDAQLISMPKKDVIVLLGPAQENKLKITNLSCEVSLGISSYTNGSTGKEFYRIVFNLETLPPS